MSRDDVTDQQLKDFLAAKDFTAEQQEELQMIYGILSGSLQGFVNAISQMLDQREELELKTRKNNEALIDDLILDALNKTYIKAIQDTRTMIDECYEVAEKVWTLALEKQALVGELINGMNEPGGMDKARAWCREQYVDAGMNPDEIDKLSDEQIRDMLQWQYKDYTEKVKKGQDGMLYASEAGVALTRIDENVNRDDPNSIQQGTENAGVINNVTVKKTGDLNTSLSELTNGVRRYVSEQNNNNKTTPNNDQEAKDQKADANLAAQVVRDEAEVKVDIGSVSL